MNQYLILILSCLPTLLLAQIPNQDNHQLDLTQTQRQNFQQTTPILANTSTTSTAEPIHVSEQTLLENPLFLEQLLDSALAEYNIEGVRVLIPIYQQWQNHDEILLLYAQATVNQADGDYKEAISHYRKIIAQRPDLTPMRVRLTESLILDKQFNIAQQQIVKIKSEQDIPDDIVHQLTQAEEWLKKQQKWHINANVRYLNDKNVNQAPKQQKYGVWNFPTPISAEGLGYDVSMYKNQVWLNNWSWRGGLTMYGKSYWNAHDYDDISLQGQLGIAYQNAEIDVAVLPFYRYRWFATDAYLQEIGLSTQLQYHFDTHWHGFATIQYSEKQHHQRTFLDGWLWHNSMTLLYTPSSTQAWFIGGDFIKEKPHDVSERYHHIGLRLGWEQEWQRGISTNSYVGIAKRQYQAPDIFQIQRQDTEYFAKMSVWHRALHWHGFTPKVSWLWNKTDSRHFLYDQENNQLFLEISKNF